MKIAFVGDSFCADTNLRNSSDDGSWLNLVLKEYDAEMLCKGREGIALFHVYEDLLRIIDEADYIILCITDAFRLPNRFGIAMAPIWHRNSRDFKKMVMAESEDEKAVKAGKWYYNEIMSFEFHQVAQKGILMQMDELLIEKKKKSIWFPCFEDELSMQSYTPKSGPIASHYLNFIVELERDPKDAPWKKQMAESGNDPRNNHMNLRNNQNMARLIIDIIKNDNFSPHEIKMEDYFEGLE